MMSVFLFKFCVSLFFILHLTKGWEFLFIGIIIFRNYNGIAFNVFDFYGSLM